MGSFSLFLKGEINMRIARCYYTSKFFHVMVQGIRRERIFNENYLKEKFIDLSKEISNENNVSILAYCVMNNHAHILVYTEDVGNLSKMMHSLNMRYANKYNKLKHRCGYVFRNRYRCENITTIEEHAFANSGLYEIELNGVEFIGKKAFASCHTLTKFNVKSSSVITSDVTILTGENNEGIFFDTYTEVSYAKHLKIYIPASVVSEYLALNYWNVYSEDIVAYA